jgi:hypothetical protein
VSPSMPGGAAADAPPTPATARERWELVPAEFGSGSWLLASGAGELRAWAPPGVVLDGADQEPVERWTTARAVFGERFAAGGATIATLAQVLAQVPADFARWALDCTADQVRFLGLYAAAAGDPEAGDFAASARVVREELAAELETQLRLRRPQVRERAGDPERPVPNVFSALSDHEFAELARRLLTEQRGSSCCTPAAREYGIDLFFEDPDGTRHVAQLHHGDPQALPVPERAEQDARRLREARPDADVYWYVSSMTLSPSARREVVHAIGPWAPPQQHVVAAEQLQLLLEADPSVAAHHPKLRVAQAMACGLLDGKLQPHVSAAWPSLADTEPIRAARETLWNAGAIVVSGEPGSGKTTLGTALLADAMLEGYEAVIVDGPPDELALEPQGDRPRVVLWDGADDGRVLQSLLRSARRLKDVLVIAIAGYMAYPAAPPAVAFPMRRYARRDRARILYNHVWHAEDLAEESREALSDPYVCRAIVDHPAFSPRLAERATTLGPIALGAFMPHLHCDPLSEPPDDEVDCLLQRIQTRLTAS